MKNKKETKKIIAISGTPGTGKSTLAKIVEKRMKFKRIDLHDHYKNISTGYDKSKRCYDIDMKLFEKMIKYEIKKLSLENYEGMVIDTHISHKLPSKLIDLCVILTCSNLKKLSQRLKDRKYFNKKIEENIESEIFQICLIEAQENKHKIITFDTSKRITQKEFIEKIKMSL